MARTKISEFSATPASNTDIDSIFIGEGMAPSNVNDAIRELMAQLKDWQSGTSNDPYVIGSSGSLTLNQGTANTVPYLNGSKVVTSGTALSFDGTNLGLGVTPSAWVSGRNCVEIGGSVQPSIAFNGSTVANGGGIWTNGYNNGTNNIYKANGTASRLDTGSGGFAFYLAPSGTAGNAITFTQAMTLDASGNLGVGTTSPATRLHVAGSTGLTLGAVSGDAWRTAAIVPIDEGSAYRGSLAFYTHPSAGSAGAPTERARIDSSGNLLVGTTSTSVANGGFMVFQSTPTATGIFIGHATGTASGTTYSAFRFNNTDIGSITQSGTTAVLYNTTSDQRLKENIVDSPEFGSVIDSIKVRSYDWKSDGSHQRAGFVAQELVTVAPEAVHQPEDSEEMMAVDYSKLVPMLVKEVQSLRKRLADAGIA